MIPFVIIYGGTATALCGLTLTSRGELRSGAILFAIAAIAFVGRAAIDKRRGNL